MSDITRRTLITRGLAAAAGLSGLALAERLADRYGLVPPDHGGVYGPGETLTYAAQRLLTRHSLARERVPREQPLRGVGQRLARPVDAAVIGRDEPVAIGEALGERQARQPRRGREAARD